MLRKHLCPLLAAALACLPTCAQAQAPADSATFLLHKFAQCIGKETYRLTRTAQAHTYDVDFKFVDRGSPVVLRAQLVLTPAGEPLRLAVKGQTSCFSSINDTVRVDANGQARIRVDDAVRTEQRPALSFPVAGYSPGTGQRLLLRYWQQHGRPASLAMLPSGTVRIRDDGQDTLHYQHQPLLGMDQVNHIMYVARVLRRNPDRSLILDDTTGARVFAFLKAHHTVIDPTVGVFELGYRSTKDDITALEPDFGRLPQPLQALFVNMGQEPTAAAKSAPFSAGQPRLVKVLNDHGIPIVAGTDMGFPGTSLARELELYVQGGLTPMQALQAATIDAARAMQLDARAGSLDVGKQADLVIIDGNPLANMRDIRRVQLVVKGGQVYEPAQMRQLADYQQ